MIFLLFSSVSILENSDRGIVIEYENLINAPTTHLVAIPPGAKVRVDYTVLEWKSAPRGLNLYSSHDSPLNYRVVRGEVDHVVLTFNPVLRGGKVPVRWRVRISLSGGGKGDGRWRPIYRRFINYPFPREWIRGRRVAPGKLGFINGARYWVRMNITTSGVYRVYGSDLTSLGIPAGELRFDGVLLLGLFDTLRSDIEWADSGAVEIAYGIHDADGDGMMDAEDYIFFYAEGPDGFRSSDSTIFYFIHPYSNFTSYWLGIGAPSPGIRMGTSSVSSSSPLPALGIYHHEIQRFNPGRKGTAWVGEEMTYGSHTFDFTLEGLTSPSGTLSVSIVGAEDLGDFTGYGTVDVFLNGNLVATVNTYNARKSTLTVPVSNLSPQGSITFRVNGTNQMVYLDYFEIRYSRSLPSYGKVFSSVTGTYHLGDAPLILRITDPAHPVILSSGADEVSPGDIYFKSDTFLSPSLHYVNIGRDIRNLGDVAYVIIGKEIFRGVFDSYREFRRSRMPVECDTIFCAGSGNVEYVSLEEIYDQFSLGVPDPVAIRNFLYSLYNSTPSLLYALFVGDATYDYRGYITTEGNLFPVYYDVKEVYDINITGVGSWDDFYADFDGNGYADIYIGRIPVRNSGETGRIISRVMDYETSRFFSFWRNRVMLVADDFVGSSPCEITWHLVPSDYIRRNLIPLEAEVWTLYMHEYPTVGGTKPQATSDFISKYNSGNLIVNVFAHGNPSTIAGERLITLDNVHLLNTAGHNPFVMILSCKVSVFDRISFAGPRGLGELMFIEDGGAIGLLGATALSYVTGNQIYANTIFSTLMDYRKYPMGFLALQGKTNKYYVLFGDPSVSIGYEPPDSVIWAPDTAYVGALYSAYLGGQGQYFSTIGFLPDTITVTNCSYTYTYMDEDKTFFRAPLYSDSLRAIIPKNTPVARKLKVRALYRGGVKGRDSISVAFDPARIAQDTIGPSIRMMIGGRDVRDSMSFSPVGTFRIVLSDENGIYLSPGERDIEVYVDGQLRWTLTQSFSYYENSYTEGEALLQYDLTREQGWHRLTIRAWDNYDNLSIRDYVLYFASNQLEVSDFLLYPVPFRGGDLYFTFVSTAPATGRVLLYDMSGNLVYSSPLFTVNAGFNSVVWEDARLGSGLYIAVLKLESSGIRKVYRKKLVVVR